MPLSSLRELSVMMFIEKHSENERPQRFRLRSLAHIFLCLGVASPLFHSFMRFPDSTSYTSSRSRMGTAHFDLSSPSVQAAPAFCFHGLSPARHPSLRLDAFHARDGPAVPERRLCRRRSAQSSRTPGTTARWPAPPRLFHARHLRP